MVHFQFQICRRPVQIVHNTSLKRSLTVSVFFVYLDVLVPVVKQPDVNADLLALTNPSWGLCPDEEGARTLML